MTAAPAKDETPGADLIKKKEGDRIPGFQIAVTLRRMETNELSLEGDAQNTDEIAPPNLVHELVGDLKALAEEAAAVFTAGELSHDAIVTLKAQFEVARENFAGLAVNVGRSTVAAAKRTDEVVRLNPYRSIAITFLFRITHRNVL